jgi:large subunit ribosomal protein L20
MRATNGPVTRQRRKAMKRRVEGHWGTKHTSYKIARQSVIRASTYALRDRRAKKRTWRKLWISRITAAVRPLGYNYSTFINALAKQNILMNRKMLSEMAINNPVEFEALVKQVMTK